MSGRSPAFSSRTAWDRRPNRIADLRAQAEANGRRLLDLTESNPTRVGLEWPQDALAAALGRGRVEGYTPEARGLASARQAVSRRLLEGGVEVSPEHLVLTASTSEAYALLFKLLCDPGDCVMTPTPSYPLFDYLTDLESVRAVPYPLRLRDRWTLDTEALADRLLDDTRAVVVVTPNNPTGSLLDDAECGAVAALCAERGLALVSDEVFMDFRWNAGDPRPLGVLDAARGAGALAFSLGGLSKSCGLPQLKLAWIAVAGPDRDRDEALGRLEVIADTYLSVGTPVQLALPEILELSTAFRSALMERLLANLTTLRHAAAGAGARVLPADGGWTALVEVPGAPDLEAACEALLAEDGVLVHPPWLYELPSDVLAVSLLPTPEDFAAAMALLLARTT